MHALHTVELAHVPKGERGPQPLILRNWTKEIPLTNSSGRPLPLLMDHSLPLEYSTLAWPPLGMIILTHTHYSTLLELTIYTLHSWWNETIAPSQANLSSRYGLLHRGAILLSVRFSVHSLLSKRALVSGHDVVPLV